MAKKKKKITANLQHVNSDFRQWLLEVIMISKASASVSTGFQTRENSWKHEAAGRVLLLFSSLKPRWNTKREFLKLLLQQKKISLNYHLKKFSQFSYYIWDVKYSWTSKNVCEHFSNSLIIHLKRLQTRMQFFLISILIKQQKARGDKQLYYINTSVLLGFLPLRKSIYFHM